MLHDYFDTHTLPKDVDTTKAAIGVAETGGDWKALHSLVWGIGAVVSALLRHDIQIVALVELPYPDMYRGLGDAADCVPAVSRLMGKRS